MVHCRVKCKINWFSFKISMLTFRFKSYVASRLIGLRLLAILCWILPDFWIKSTLTFSKHWERKSFLDKLYIVALESRPRYPKLTAISMGKSHLVPATYTNQNCMSNHITHAEPVSTSLLLTFHQRYNTESVSPKEILQSLLEYKSNLPCPSACY